MLSGHQLMASKGKEKKILKNVKRKYIIEKE
jgi:hypothetical protein